MGKKSLNKILQQSPTFYFDDNSKIVFMSDIHRGDGTQKDNLSINWNIYKVALNYYYSNGFIYTELGDGDELWESNIYSVYEANIELFDILKKFKEDNRLIMILGNHDKSKGKKSFIKTIKRKYRNHDDDIKEGLYEFFGDLNMYDGVLFKNEIKNIGLFATHGHQLDFINCELAWFSSFLVRYLWSFLETYCGFKAPTLPAKRITKAKKIDRDLENWVKENKQPTITGHTHRTRLPYDEEIPYFNDGSAVKPHVISCIELQKGILSLVKWNIDCNDNAILTVTRKVIGSSKAFEKYFKYN